MSGALDQGFALKAQFDWLHVVSKQLNVVKFVTMAALVAVTEVGLKLQQEVSQQCV